MNAHRRQRYREQTLQREVKTRILRIKCSPGNSRVRLLDGKSTFRGPSLPSSSGNLLPAQSVRVVICLSAIAGGETIGGLVGPLTFTSMLVTGDQAWLSMKPPSLLTLLRWMSITTSEENREYGTHDYHCVINCSGS